MREWDYRGYRDMLMEYAAMYGFERSMDIALRSKPLDVDMVNGELVLSDEERSAIFEDNFLKAARMLGCTREEVLARDEKALTRVYHMYQRYFDLRLEWADAREQACSYSSRYLGSEDYQNEYYYQQCAQRALLASVSLRAAEKLKGMSGEFPCLWPEGAQWKEFAFRTSFFVHFPAVRELSVEHDKVLARTEELYLKAIAGPLESIEASEFNVLASCLMAKYAAASFDHLCYESIDANRQYLQEEGTHTFATDVFLGYDDATFWEAREFYDDPAFVAKYILSHPFAKKKIRDFVTSALNFTCEYRLSTHPYYAKGLGGVSPEMLSPEEYEESLPDSVLVEKNIAELGADRESIRKVEKLLSSHLVGGLDTREIDAKGKRPQESFMARFTRMRNRIESGRWVSFR